jgi:hypothetical protein
MREYTPSSSDMSSKTNFGSCPRTKTRLSYASSNPSVAIRFKKQTTSKLIGIKSLACHDYSVASPYIDQEPLCNLSNYVQWTHCRFDAFSLTILVVECNSISSHLTGFVDMSAWARSSAYINTCELFTRRSATLEF